MQSSATVVFRALVMLACLVAIPLAAVVGRSLPDMVKGLVDGQWPGSSAPAYGSSDDAPRFEPSAAADTLRPAADWTGTGRQPPPLERAPAWPAWPVGPVGSTVVAAGHGGPSAVDPKQRQTSLPTAFGAAEPPPGASIPAPRAQPADDQSTVIQERLRQLGATYYLLESWGSREQLYRFYCKVAVGGNPNYTQYFEATDSDPLRTMTRVLQQVEAWRAERKVEGGGWKAEGFGRPG